MHASKYFCFTLQWRENFFNSLPVIHISDSTLLMQETVISFEEVMQTKLKVKLCIFQSLSNPCILQKRVVFQAKVFFSNSWFIVINYIVNFVFRKWSCLCFTFTVKQNSFLSYSILINWVFFIVIGYLWIISQLVNSSGLKFSYSTFPQSCFFWDYYISKSLTLFSKSQIVHVLPLRSNKFSFLAIGISSFESFLSLLAVFESFCHKQKFWKVCKSVSHEWLWAYWISKLSRLIFDQIRKLLLKYWLHASKYLFFTLKVARKCSQRLSCDPNQRQLKTVISFEVRETKLKVKLCISQSFMQSLCIAKESCFSSKSRVRELLIYR